MPNDSSLARKVRGFILHLLMCSFSFKFLQLFQSLKGINSKKRNIYFPGLIEMLASINDMEDDSGRKSV